VLHHHVRIGVVADVQRVARLLAGRAVGLALGGGGARAFAHIGVIRAFREGGIPIDLIGGTSMGGVMAAQVAAGWDVETMMEASRRAFCQVGLALRLHAPLHVTDRWPPLHLVCSARLFKDVRVEDLWLKYFCISTNLTRRGWSCTTPGPLARWLCATISVPGLAPPVFHAGDLLVDGSLLDTVPQRRHSPLSPWSGRRGRRDGAGRRRGGSRVRHPRRQSDRWEISLGSREPVQQEAASQHLQDPAALHHAQQRGGTDSADADLYIRPPWEQFDLLEWKSFDRIVDLGYRTACERLTEWARSGGAPRACCEGPLSGGAARIVLGRSSTSARGLLSTASRRVAR
jgi:predicted acylesterase/phospholipase RssA